MEYPATSEEHQRNQQAPASSTYETFASTYPSEFNSMLAAQNAVVGHSLSPSTSYNERFSPATMLSDPAYDSMAEYESFGNINNDEHITSQQFNELLSLSENTGLGYGNQAPDQAHSATLEIPQPQAFAWVQTGQNRSSSVMPSIEGQQTGSYSGNPQQTGLHHLSPSQGSPAGSCSSRQLISPIVRVESYEETTQPLQQIQNMDHLSRQSTSHLSPYDSREYESDDGKDSNWLSSDQVQPMPPVQRQDDGSWSRGASGQQGLSPEARRDMNDLQVPTLDELAEQRSLEAKNAEVQHWLARSEVGDDSVEGRNASLTPFFKSGNRRRSKSTNDLGVFSAPDDSRIPGPGARLNVPSDYEEDEDSFSTNEEPVFPPAQVDVPTRDSYFTSISEDSHASGPIPWVDPPTRKSTNEKQYQPPTANAAMMRFKQRAKDIESASLAATLGSSRRRSESDMGSVRTATGISRDLSAHPKEKSHRMENLLQKITPRRNNSNLRKRKGTVAGGQSQVDLNDGSSGTSTPKERQPSAVPPKRIGSWGRPKSPMLDTSSDTINAPATSGNNLNVTSPSTPWGMARNAIRRSRSRSEIGRSRSKSDSGRSPGLGELMTQFGGPPMPTLASPGGAAQSKPISSNTAVDFDDDSGDEGGALTEGITMDLRVRTDPIIPTHQGFHTQARQLNPRIPEYLLERVTKEQVTRYQRLVDGKGKHVKAVKDNKCSSRAYCFALGGESQPLKPRVGNKDADTQFQGFQIIKPGMSAETIEKESEGTIMAAQFPSGVPLPPVDRLPAEFECPLCFKVKKFYKPSDWTKHVHEDVQPFTCTFPACNEPKSFKRKADWVRHENERHRQLENWTCDISDCNHTCYRKDNFVQHLVREHKIPEPKARIAKGGSASSKSPVSPLTSRNWTDPYTAIANPAGYGSDDIWMIVDRCRGDTTKQPQDEACRFCGNICSTWKKLTVHLAKHMEQISMPILPLIEAKQIGSVVEAMPTQLQTLTDSPQDLPTMLSDEPLSMDLNDTFSQASITPSISVNGAQVMHTFPPPQYANPHYRATVTHTSFGALPPDTSFSARSYPGPMPTSRQGTPSGHSPYASSVQGSSYPPPRSVADPYQQPQTASYDQQMYQSPVESSGLGDEAFSAVDAAYMLSSGQVPGRQTPASYAQQGTQQATAYQSGFDQGVTFPSQHYNAYDFGGRSS